mmetsp:Transcript_12901/g.39875  ORF Transcript_12901/g.39875 Transcript_12901/m.39875 type:complete len:590 (+) Transcript_12901:62-1831(+)
MPMEPASRTVQAEPRLNDARASAETLAAGLRALRAKGLLCDVALASGKEKLLAHQAVLAAVSPPLHQYFAAEGPELGLQPLELQMAGAEQPEALQALLNKVYGADAGIGLPPGLARNLGLQASTSAWHASLAAGLNELRSKGALCDLVLVVGEERIAAHQVVLAAASPPLRRYIIDSLADLLSREDAPAADGAEPSEAKVPAEVASEPLELALEGISSVEAARAVLDHVYAVPGAAALPQAEAAIRDVLRLTNAFELPRLRERATQWLAQGVTAVNAPERLSICDEFGFAALRSRIGELAAEQETPAPRRRQAVPEPQSRATEPRREASGWSEVGSPQDMILADPALLSGLTEAERAMLDMCKAHFADDSVPDVPRQRTVEAMDQSRTRQDARTLERLYDLFEHRPVWLEGPLLKQLPAHVEQSSLMKLLPCVAYQWRDGPWQTAYARYGWDPRSHPEEARWLQVIDFRDPALRGKTAPMAGGSQAASDVHFRKPPSQPKEYYQVADIKDDFITELVRGVVPSEECSRRAGWLGQVVCDALRERLTVRSQQLRDRQAAREQAEGAKKRASGGRSSVEGRAGKRAKVAGA